MGEHVVLPQNAGFYYKTRFCTIALYAHNLQCARRWLFLVRFRINGRNYRFGYLTKGDAPSWSMSYSEAGWVFPWKKRTYSGRC